MRAGAVHNRDQSTRGAALIIAIGILTVMLIIGATFFRISQTELQTATNTTDQVRMDMMVDGATAQAIAALNEDFADNPSATSLDHQWRTRFNGASAAAKQWMWRFQGQGDLALRDLVDNDGDRAILDADGIDNDNDGLIDEGNDGVDNDGINGVDDPGESEGVDEDDEIIVRGLGADGEDNDGDGVVDEPFENADLVARIPPLVRLNRTGTESGTAFGSDGLNNDNQGGNDDGNERAIDPATNGLDDDGDGLIDEDALADPIGGIEGTIPDPPNYLYPVAPSRRLDTNLGEQIYFPRTEHDEANFVGPPIPFQPMTSPRYTRDDIRAVYDLFDGIDSDGDRALYDGDGLDNDGDGLIDEGNDGVDNDGDGVIDEVDESEGAGENDYVIALRGPGGDSGTTSAFLSGANLLREETVALWADVDNDGDGLNDSIWLPFSAPLILDNDGLDNDLDGVVDELGELGIFLYNATNDGLDNDGDGIVDNEHIDGRDNDGDTVVDEDDEMRIMLPRISGTSIRTGNRTSSTTTTTVPRWIRTGSTTTATDLWMRAPTDSTTTTTILFSRMTAWTTTAMVLWTK